MAKLFEVTPKSVNKGLPVIQMDGNNFLAVGERGRGRTMSLARVDALTLNERRTRFECDILLNQHDKLIDIQPSTHSSVYALVVIRDHSGFRGTWELSGLPLGPCREEWPIKKSPEEAEIEFEKWQKANPDPVWADPQPDYYKYASWDEKCAINKARDRNQLRALIRSWNVEELEKLLDQETEPTMLTFYHHLEKFGRCPLCQQEGHKPDRKHKQMLYGPLPKIVLEGYCAQGDAGRAGGGPEYAVLLGPGGGFTIRRGGRLYGAEPWMTYLWDGNELYSKNKTLWELDNSRRPAKVY